MRSLQCRILALVTVLVVLSFIFGSPRGPRSNFDENPSRAHKKDFTSNEDTSTKQILGVNLDPIPDGSRPLNWKDFVDTPLHHFPSGSYNRLESAQAWTTIDMLTDPQHMNTQNFYRPPMSAYHKFTNKAEFLKQPLIGDYAPHSERVFLMVKTGSTILWDRLPIHLLTTLTRVPNFAIYADVPGSIAGYEIVDVLSNTTLETLNNDAFKMYRQLRDLHEKHSQIHGADTTLAEGWATDRFKNVPMVLHAFTVMPDADWYIYMDADTFFLLDTLFTWLATLDPSAPLYMGKAMYEGTLPFNHGGSGVVLSRRAVEMVYAEHPEWVFQFEHQIIKKCCGDVQHGQFIADKTGILPPFPSEYPWSHTFQTKPWWGVNIRPEMYCKPIASFHHVTPHDIELLWEYERTRGPQASHITYSSIYRDFLLPFIDYELADWDNLAEDWVYSEELDKKEKVLAEPAERPWYSKEKCRKKCESLKGCHSWRYLPKINYCGMSEFFALGKPTMYYLNSKAETVAQERAIDAVSGYLIDRIREIRRKSHCDPLYKDQVPDGPRDGSESDFQEGWWHRRKKS